MFHVNTFNLGTPYVGDYVGSLELPLGNHNLDDGNIGFPYWGRLAHNVIALPYMVTYEKDTKQTRKVFAYVT